MIEILEGKKNDPVARTLGNLSEGRKEIINVLRQVRERSIDQRSHHHCKWPDYGRLYRGEHWRYPPIGTDSQITYNVCGKVIKAGVPLVTQGRIRSSIMPRRPGAEQKALLIQARVDEIHEQNRMSAIQGLVMTDAMHLGTGCGETWWDDQANNGRGAHRQAWCDVYNVFPDAAATSPANIKILTVRRIYGLAEARQLWPDHADELKPETSGRTERESSGLYRPIEDLPNRTWLGTQTIDDVNGLTGVQTVLPRRGGKADQYRFDDEVFVWEHHILSNYATAMLDPRVNAARGFEAEQEAEYENAELARGKWVDVAVEDDHATHRNRHRSHLRSRGSKMTRDEAELVMRHMDMHDDMEKSPEMRRLRASKYPGGWRFIQVSGDTVLYDGPQPNQSPYLPIAFMRNYEDPGYFWGLSEFTDLEPMQTGLNQTLSQIMDLIRFAAHRPLLVDSSQGITEEQLLAQVGIILWVNREKGVPPVEWAQALQLDPSWLNYAIHLEQGMLEQVGLSEIVEGGLPGSGLSGNALALIKEASMTRAVKRSEGFELWNKDMDLPLVAQIIIHDKDPMIVHAEGQQWQQMPGAVPAGNNQSYYIPMNMDGVNQLGDITIEDIGVKVTASGTAAKGKSHRRNELVGFYHDKLFGPRAMRQMLGELGDLTPQDLANIEAEEQAMAQQQGPPPPKVSVSIRGEIPPQQASAIAGGQPAPAEGMMPPPQEQPGPSGPPPEMDRTEMSGPMTM